MLQLLDLPTLLDRRLFSSLCTMYKIAHGFVIFFLIFLSIELVGLLIFIGHFCIIVP